MVGDLSAIILMLAQWSGGVVVHPTITSSIGSPGNGGGSVSDARHRNI